MARVRTSSRGALGGRGGEGCAVLAAHEEREGQVRGNDES